MKKFLALALAGALAVSTLAACGSQPAPAPAPETKAEEETKADAEETAEEIKDAVEEVAEAGDKKVGFVTFGLGGEFFQMLAAEYEAVMTEAGWDATYTDGSFDPATQIEQCENYIAMGVDVLVCWSVAPEAMGAITAKCAEEGIKFVAFVAPTEQYDALMVSDDAEIADAAAQLAAKWIDSHFADAEDHSVEVVVFGCRLADTGVIQADELDKIEEFSTKAKFVGEIECADESVDCGMENTAATLMNQPDVKVFLTAHSAIALGINNYLTSMSSPVQDYTDMGIFAINGDTAMAEIIKTSADNAAPLRGMVLTGSVRDTAEEMKYVIEGITDGTLPQGHLQKAGTLLIDVDTVDEYLANMQ